MIAVLQRVTKASVSVGGERISAIGAGLLILLGVARGDGSREAATLARKSAELRIFEDETGKMNRSLLDTRGEALVVSQFTLLADCRKGRRPAFIQAAPPSEAEVLYQAFAGELAALGVPTATGRFGAMMEVALVNDGPVTILLDTRNGAGAESAA